jgi:Protein of unknown function (DUF4239)
MSTELWAKYALLSSTPSRAPKGPGAAEVNMDPPLHIAALPLWLSALLILGIPTFAAMSCSFWIRRWVTAERLMTNNEVAGFKFATVGVIYAVMLGFAIIVVWEKFRDAEAAATQEAGAVVAIYRLSEGMDASAGATVRSRVTTYAKTVIDDDWPAMARGRISPTATHTLNDLYTAVLAGATGERRNSPVLTEIFYQLDQITQARRSRAVLAGGVVPGVVWLVLSVGAVFTITFTFFFGTSNARAQVLMTLLLSGLIFMGLLVIVTIDHPFTGPVSVVPESIALVLHEFAGGG